ncbi:hypothetical protein VMCG_09050 [Cytospora schulzeri]|uniref:Uncharacterized protein n=1 Tax=Cytospora schulzeri TaxID=448051 RepID=A0A423VP07_9PEZI|nr:hypothetical protein VMCG_09050 [Valsa malicola]
MRIPYVSAVGTLSSLDSVLTSAPANETASVVRTPLQIGDTFVPSGTTFGVDETDLAIPFGVMAAAVPLGNKAHLTGAPAQEITTTTCNPFEPNCQHYAGGCSLGCVPDFNGGCQFWGPSCYIRPTKTPDVPIPTGPAKTTQGSVTLPPRSTYLVTITSTTTSYVLNKTTSHVPWGDEKNHPTTTIDTAPLETSDGSGDSSYYAPGDELFGLLQQAVLDAALSLQQQYIDDNMWVSFVESARSTGNLDVNNDGNTVDGLTWNVRKQLGWPPTIGDPANPKPSDAAFAVRSLVTDQELEEVILQYALNATDANEETTKETPGVEKPPEQQLDYADQFPLDDIFTTDWTTNSMAWQDFEDKRAWEINADIRPYVLLRRPEVMPPIEPRAEWIKTVQVLINKHVPFEQSGQLPSDMERNLFLELDEAFRSILQEVAKNGQTYSLRGRFQATEYDILDELRYMLLYDYAPSPVLVEATDDEVSSLEMEFLNDANFIQKIGSQDVLLSLFKSWTFYQGLKDHIRAAKIMGWSIHDLAVMLEGPIHEALYKAYYDDNSRGYGGNHMLKPRGVDMGAEYDQNGSLEQAADNGHHGTTAFKDPNLTRRVRRKKDAAVRRRPMPFV